MTNFEFYKDEILNEFKTHNANIALCNLADKCHFDYYYKCFIEWGYAEHVEPYKLTRFEKFILENINERAIYIEITKGGVPWISGDGFVLGCVSDYFPKATFNCLKGKGKCKISDILDNCEVVD